MYNDYYISIIIINVIIVNYIMLMNMVIHLDISDTYECIIIIYIYKYINNNDNLF